ncbi:hypothetical protein CB1_001408013 [Camelus ferus]|nr:hypothetical protein CB1_001408013 [Camelus ferus]
MTEHRSDDLPEAQNKENHPFAAEKESTWALSYSAWLLTKLNQKIQNKQKVGLSDGALRRGLECLPDHHNIITNVASDVQTAQGFIMTASRDGIGVGEFHNGVRRASDWEIKRAYRRQALRYRPDKNKEPCAKERFKEIAKRSGEEGMDIDDPFSGFPMDMGGFTNMNFGCSRPAQESTQKQQDPPATHDLRVSLEI